MPHTNQPGLLRSSALVLVAAFGLGSAVVLANLGPDGAASYPTHAEAQLLDPAQPFAVSDVAEAVLPGVVSVTVKQVVQAPQYEMPPGMHRWFDPFLDFGNRGPQERSGQGSGVIVDAKAGVILTNNHVITEADEIIVTLSDGTDIPADVVGTDPMTDVAVIKLRPDGRLPKLTAVPIGDSDSLRLGEVVLAVGNPFGYAGTVTMGIVSAKGRSDARIARYSDFIQTDAAINPGNSGGALVNMRGELVGINTAIASRSGSSAGIGFAIPTALATPIMESLLTTGRVERGYLGVQMQPLDTALAERLGARGSNGVVVADVVPGSPAERGGLRSGDVIEQLDDVPINSTARLSTEVALRPAGSKVQLEVLRDGKRKALKVELGQQPDSMLAAFRGRDELDMRRESGDVDLRVGSLDDAARRRFGISERATSGVVVEEVAPGSTAARVGLRPGDVILELNRQPVDSPAEFERRYAGSGSVMVRVLRGNSVLFLVFDK